MPFWASLREAIHTRLCHPLVSSSLLLAIRELVTYFNRGMRMSVEIRPWWNMLQPNICHLSRYILLHCEQVKVRLDVKVQERQLFGHFGQGVCLAKGHAKSQLYLLCVETSIHASAIRISGDPCCYVLGRLWF